MPDESIPDDRLGRRPFSVKSFQLKLQSFQMLLSQTRVKTDDNNEEQSSATHETLHYEQFCKSVQSLFGEEVKSRDLKAVFRKISANPEAPVDWIELFGYFQSSNDDVLSGQMDEENSVFMISKRKIIGQTGNQKGRDVVQCIAKMPKHNLIIASTLLGTLAVYNRKMVLQSFTSIQEPSWVNGCGYLRQLNKVAAITENSIVIWDHKPKSKKQAICWIIKPMERFQLCVCTMAQSGQHHRDEILIGDDSGFISLVTVVTNDLSTKHSTAEGVCQSQVLDPSNLCHPIVRRKLHNDWVVKVSFIPELNCFGSCSVDSIHSLVLDNLKRLEDNEPVRELSVPRGVNAFAYCAKANILATGGCDKIIRIWHPDMFSKSVGTLTGHLYTISDIVINQKDQHIISLSTARVFRIWDIATLSLLQVFLDIEEAPGDKQTYSMIFDNKRNWLITGSSVIKVWPLTRAVQDTMQVPHSHERAINVLVYNTVLHQVLSICSESIIKVWELETGYQIYQIPNAHGPNVEVTAAAVDTSGSRFATGAFDGSLKVWDFVSGQELTVLPPINECTEDQSLNQLVYLKQSEQGHIIVALNWSSKIRIIQVVEDSDFTVFQVFPDAFFATLKKDPSGSSLLQSHRKVNGNFQSVPSMPQAGHSYSSVENSTTGVELTCLDVVTLDGFTLLATGCTSGLVMLWDFDSASILHLCKDNSPYEKAIEEPEQQLSFSDSEHCRVNDLKFLVHKSKKANIHSSSQSPMPSQENIEHNMEDTNNNKKLLEAEEADKEDNEADENPETGAAPSVCQTFPLPPLSAVKKCSVLLVSAHRNGYIYFWNTKGDCVKKLLPNIRQFVIPWTAVCTDSNANILFTGSQEGDIVLWDIAAFLENPDSQSKKLVRLRIRWRAHAAKIINLFYVESESVIVSASTDGSIRVWYAPKGHYIGYFGQYKELKLTEPSEVFLPCDITEGPLEEKPEKKKDKTKQRILEYPLVFDVDRWKECSKSAFVLKKQLPSESLDADKETKFFKALSLPKFKRSPMESYKSGDVRGGAIFRALPIYRIRSPVNMQSVFNPERHDYQMFHQSLLIRKSQAQLNSKE